MNEILRSHVDQETRLKNVRKHVSCRFMNFTLRKELRQKEHLKRKEVRTSQLRAYCDQQFPRRIKIDQKRYERCR